MIKTKDGKRFTNYYVAVSNICNKILYDSISDSDIEMWEKRQMEILFRNKNNVCKFCLKTKADNIYELSKKECLFINDTVALNAGFRWEPVATGFAAANKLPLLLI